MEPHRELMLRTVAQWPAAGTSQVREAWGGRTKINSQMVTPILDWLVRHGYVKRLDPVFGPHGWERAWAVTRQGRAYLCP